MQRTIHTMLLSLVALCVGGCSIAGTWQTVKITPEEGSEHFHLQTVTFSPENEYSATETRGSETVTSKGNYKWDGMTLTIQPTDGAERKYGGCLCMDGKLKLSHEMDGRKVTAELEKKDEMAE